MPSFHKAPLSAMAWTCQHMGLLIILLLFSGCASNQVAPPPQVVYPAPVSVAPRTPDFQEAWDRCVQQNAGDSYCSSKYRRVENNAPDSSVVTEGEFIHSNRTPEKSATGDVIVILSEQEKQKQRARPHPKQHAQPKPTAPPKPAAPPKPIVQPTPPERPRPSGEQTAITGCISVLSCKEDDINHSRQIQDNIQSLRGSLREWMRSQGDY